jgi:hypothetical protein
MLHVNSASQPHRSSVSILKQGDRSRGLEEAPVPARHHRKGMHEKLPDATVGVNDKFRTDSCDPYRGYWLLHSSCSRQDLWPALF